MTNRKNDKAATECSLMNTKWLPRSPSFCSHLFGSPANFLSSGALPPRPQNPPQKLVCISCGGQAACHLPSCSVSGVRSKVWFDNTNGKEGYPTRRASYTEGIPHRGHPTRRGFYMPLQSSRTKLEKKKKKK